MNIIKNKTKYMENLGKITDVKVLKQGRGGLNGVTIEFETDITINNESVVQISYKDSLKPFYVNEIEIINGKLLGRAVECGYWGRKLNTDKDLDLRELIGIDVELVTDKNRLKDIRNSSCMC